MSDLGSFPFARSADGTLHFQHLGPAARQAQKDYIDESMLKVLKEEFPGTEPEILLSAFASATARHTALEKESEELAHKLQPFRQRRMREQRPIDSTFSAMKTAVEEEKAIAFSGSQPGDNVESLRAAWAAAGRDPRR